MRIRYCWIGLRKSWAYWLLLEVAALMVGIELLVVAVTTTGPVALACLVVMEAIFEHWRVFRVHRHAAEGGRLQCYQ